MNFLPYKLILKDIAFNYDLGVPLNWLLEY